MRSLIYLLILLPLLSVAQQIIPPADFTRYAQNGSGGTYTLPVATSSVLGGVKKGAGLSIGGDGTAINNLSWFYVTDYGAVGDGTTNVTTNIQAAINAAHVSGGTVYLPAGIFLVDTLKSYPNVLIRGESRNNTVLKAHSANTILTMVVTTGTYMLNGIFVQDLQFDGNNVGTRAIYLKLFARAQIVSVYIHDFTTYGIYGDGALVYSILYSTIANCGTGLYATSGFANDSNLISLYDCQIVNNTTWGIQWIAGVMLTLNSCDLEANGTANNANTGAMYCNNMGAAGEGLGLNINQSWFEANFGTTLKITSSNYNINAINNSFFLPGTGTTTAIQIIGSNTVGLFNGISIDGTFSTGLIVDAATVYNRNAAPQTSTNSIINSGHLVKNGQQLHTIFTPTTGGTVSLSNNQYNIINPAGTLVALTVNLPSSPANNDCVYIKYTQSITTVTYGNGTVVDGITAPTAGGLVVLTYDGSNNSWY